MKYTILLLALVGFAAATELTSQQKLLLHIRKFKLKTNAVAAEHFAACNQKFYHNKLSSVELADCLKQNAGLSAERAAVHAKKAGRRLSKAGSGSGTGCEYGENWSGQCLESPLGCDHSCSEQITRYGPCVTVSKRRRFERYTLSMFGQGYRGRDWDGGKYYNRYAKRGLLSKICAFGESAMGLAPKGCHKASCTCGGVSPYTSSRKFCPPGFKCIRAMLSPCVPVEALSEHSTSKCMGDHPDGGHPACYTVGTPVHPACPCNDCPVGDPDEDDTTMGVTTKRSYKYTEQEAALTRFLCSSRDVVVYVVMEVFSGIFDPALGITEAAYHLFNIYGMASCKEAFGTYVGCDECYSDIRTGNDDSCIPCHEADTVMAQACNCDVNGAYWTQAQRYHTCYPSPRLMPGSNY